MVLRSSKPDKVLIETYIRERFYVVNEIEFNFWILCYKRYFNLAILLADNDFETVSLFVN